MVIVSLGRTFQYPCGCYLCAAAAAACTPYQLGVSLHERVVQVVTMRGNYEMCVKPSPEACFDAAFTYCR